MGNGEMGNGEVDRRPTATATITMLDTGTTVTASEMICNAPIHCGLH